MAFLIGLVLAILVGLFATAVGLDRDRAFYPTVMIVIATYYILFAVAGAPAETVFAESVAAAVFVAAAAWGFRFSLWIVALALAAHGLFDVFHASLIPDPGVPAWWPSFCLAYDVAAGAYLAFRLHRGRARAAA
jgi:hypothetical protein